MKGTRSFGKHNKIVHIRCRRCGRHSFHARLGKCSACGWPRSKMRNESWRWKPVNRSRRKFLKPKHQKPKTKYRGWKTAKIR